MSRRTPAVNCIANVPDYVKASWSPAERRYFEAAYRTPRLGPEWITAHRRVEMQMADPLLRDFFAGYWPHEAREWLQDFKRSHFDTPPGVGIDDSLRRRISKHYPELFIQYLDPRMAPLFEATDTHPLLREYRARYETLRETYIKGLEAAATVAAMYPPSMATRKRQHDDYRAVFLSIYESLRDTLDELCMPRGK